MSANQQRPIVLVHGFARFDILAEILRAKLDLPDDPLGEQFQYFKGIRSHLQSHGFTVFRTNQDFAGSIELRAGQLKARINEVLAETGTDKVHVIAHSMGGLDTRHMIVDMEMHDRVASLTTIGTPHFGSVIADHVLNNGGAFLVDGLRRVINVDGIGDLTIAACDAFNRRAEDAEARNGVRYQTYASFEDVHLVFVPLVPSWLIIRDREGRNDGLVPFRSQQWQKELVATDGTRKAVIQREFPFPADHLNQVGWWDPQEAANPSTFFQNVFKQAQDYETKVKNVYLEIARSL